VQEYKLFQCFGNNIVTTEFEEWKRYRKIAAPAFSEVRDDRGTTLCCALSGGSKRNNNLAFEESVRVITSLYEGAWRGKQEVVVDDALDLTMEVSSAVRLAIGMRLIDCFRQLS
jgi:hypothetical protein